MGLRRLFSGHSVSLRSHLTALVLITLIPLLIFSALMISLVAKRERDTFERGARDRTRAVLTAVDTELKSSITTLEALASLSHFDRDDLRSFRQDALDVLRSQPHWLAINLAEPSGQQVLNLFPSSDATLMTIHEGKSFQQVLRTVKPAVGDMRQNPITHNREFSVRVPIVRNGVIKYVLSAVIGPQAIYQLLLAQKLPSEWVGVVLDFNDRFVGRTASPQQNADGSASASLKAALDRAPEGWFKATIEGRNAYTAYSRSSFSGWTVALTIPTQIVSAPFRGPALYLVLWGIALLLIGTALASWQSSKTAASIEDLVRMVMDLGLGKLPGARTAEAHDRPSNVTEVENLKDAFLTARRLIEERSQERDRFEQALYHDITRRVRAERFLLLQIAASRALADSDNLASATSKIVRAICELTGWEVAIIWSVDRKAGVLRLAEVWQMPGANTPEFVAATRRAQFAPGVGLAGRVWASGEAVWMSDLTKDDNSFTRVQAVKEGLHTGVGFPLRTGSEVLGVIECFSTEIRQPDNETLGTLTNIGVQIGQFIERKQAEEEIAQLNEELEARVATRTRELQQVNAKLLHDMEERKRLEEQLLQSQKMESIGTLAGGVAHDFNNILNIIQAYASLLAPHGANGGEIADCVTVIQDTVKRGSALVQQLLTVARKSEGPALEPLDLNTLIEGLLPLIRETFPKTIEVSCLLESQLPRTMADKNQIEQALLNLSVNARDAMPAGGRLTFKTRAVDASALQHLTNISGGVYVCIEVSDTGVGIDEHIRERIFEPFFTTKDTSQGTGLGLSVVYGIVKNHNGFVDLDSKPTAGTSFRLYFPVAPVAPHQPEPDLEIAAETTTTCSAAQTVLIAEDEANMLHLLEKIFSRHGYKVLSASNGQIALDIYQRYKKEIAVVFLDMGLPKISGRDVLRQIKDAKSDVKVIVTSGYIEPVTRLEIDYAGVRFLRKPYTPEEVFKTLGSLVEGAS